MQIDDAALMAFVMGDLSPGAAARIEAALDNDPRLAARLERIRGVRRALRTAYDSVAAEPVPERLRALLGDVAASESAHLPRPIGLMDTTPPPHSPTWRSAPVWAALAVGAILGVLIGRLAFNDDIVVAEAGAMRPSAALTRVLDTRLGAAQENAAAPVRVGVSFVAQGGQVCRTFAQPTHTIVGLACHEGEAWDVRLVETAPSFTAAVALNNLIDEIMLGEPLSARAEQAARSNAWRAANGGPS